MQQKTKLYLGLLRPKTLLSSLSAVSIPICYALRHSESVSLFYSLLLVLIALTAQIASNIANDIGDFKKGSDTSARKGPLRPLSKGLLSLKEVKLALYLDLFVLLICGVSLSLLVNPYLLLVGLSVVVGLFAYTFGRFSLSRNALGEVAVFIFFGLVPVLVGAYILGLDIWQDRGIWLLASAVGFASCNILLVNNYRDYEEDKGTNKRTLTVLLGRQKTLLLYLAFALLSILLTAVYIGWSSYLICLVLYMFPLMQSFYPLWREDEVKYNLSLAWTARNVLLLSVIINLGIFIS